MKLTRQLPLRLVTGAFILNAGIAKRHADAEHADRLHGFATGAYPFLKRIRPETFTRLLSTAEIGLGSALLLPVVPSAVAGLGLAAFSGGLLGLYVRTPGMHTHGRPTDQGTALAKDVWMMGIALSLMADGIGDDGS